MILNLSPNWHAITAPIFQVFLLFLSISCIPSPSFQNKVEGLRENLYLLPRENLRALLRLVLELTEDFTDSAYTSHETRGRILELSKQAKMELEQLVSAWINAVRKTFFPAQLLV